jgi:hypothetical protein
MLTAWGATGGSRGRLRDNRHVPNSRAYAVPASPPPGPSHAASGGGDDEPCYSSTCISAVNSLATE